MKRRTLHSIALAMLVAEVGSAHAQTKTFRIGYLTLAPASAGGPARSVAKALQDLGYIEGRNVVHEFRFADWQNERLHEQAAELARSKVDVIVAITNLPGFAAKRAAGTTPIVVWGIHGAVETGLVKSLARPGGNVTGVESLAPELDAKRLELLKEIAPKLTRLGVIYNGDDQGAPVHLTSTRAAGAKLGTTIVPLEVRQPVDFDRVLSQEVARSLDGLLVFTDDLTATHWSKVAAFASEHRLPTACEFRFLAQLGCLVAYGSSLDEFTQRVAAQVDRILKGARAGDLPVEQATRFELLLNLKTAKALSVTISQSVLVRADDVIR